MYIADEAKRAAGLLPVGVNVADTDAKDPLCNIECRQDASDTAK